jgi:glycerol-3-phosphate O-acyltransferase
MSRWVSKGGEWHPAKEHAVLPHLAGTDKEIYDGPDRAALYELFQQKVEHLGQNFKHDVDLLNRIKQLGYKDMKEYCKAVGYDEEKAEKDFQEKAAQVKSHEIEAKIKAIETLGGGADLSGGGADKYGGFGKPKD